MRAYSRATGLVAAAAATLMVALAADPTGAQEAEVRFTSGEDGPELAATVTLPEGPGPFPGAVLLTVAGPNDRHQTMPGGHQTFRALADSLARRGIASIRADDRGVGGSGGDLFQADTDALAGDALAALEALAGRPEVDGGRVGMIGNSEGALIAAAAGARSDRVAFVIMLAGPGVRGADVIRARNRGQLERQGVPEARARAMLDRFDRIVAIVEEGGPEARARLEELAGGRPLLPPYGFVPSDPQEQIDFVLTPWYRSQILAEPQEVLKRVSQPVLAITGSLDRVNLADQNLPAILRALTEGGNEDHTVAELPGLNHFMMLAEQGGLAEVPELEHAFSPLAAGTLGDWIEARFGSGAPAR